MRDAIDDWLEPFRLDAALRGHTVEVMAALPEAIRSDLMTPGVRFYDYDPGPGVVLHVPVALPRRAGIASRSIVLKRTLRHREPAFVRWLIAHELAHAHLRNGGRWPGDDPEVAADALALDWGFPRPSRW